VQVESSMRPPSLLIVLLLAAPAAAQTRSLPLDLSSLRLENVTAEVVDYRGKRATRITERNGVVSPGYQGGASALAIVLSSDFQNGTIEAEIAGLPRSGADSGARGFVGIAFRVEPNAARFEAFYLRPTNGRADDQLRRNHATQYISHPDYPWHRLRREHPGRYESYTDLEPGVWTPIRIVVAGRRAELYVNRNEQPALIVTDLKHGESRGAVALWIGLGTEAYFANLTVR
jgi:hypothetical protein